VGAAISVELNQRIPHLFDHHSRPIMRIATWNLERPRRNSVRRVPGQLAQIERVDADLWILTETSDAIDLGTTHPHRVASVVLDRPGETRENWVTIWSRYPLHPIETDGGAITVCAAVETPGRPTIVYGTVLPYTGDPGPDGTSRGWAEFLRVVPLQAAEWTRLRAEHPDHRFCVAGDFNQSRDRRRWDGREWCSTRATRTALDNGLASAGLVSATDEDFVATGKLTTRSNIDHVALDAASNAGVRDVGAWEAGQGDGPRLSDHNGVWVDVDLDSSA
jgi:hypothetical protein